MKFNDSIFKQAAVAIRVFSAGMSLLCLSFALAASAEARQVTHEIVCEGLSNPFGVAVQPESNRVFVAESGLQRVVAIEDGQPRAVVEGFFKNEFEDYLAGPLSILFMDKDHMWVGHSESRNKSAVSLYSLPADAKEIIKADKHDKTVTPKEVTGMPTLSNYRSLAFCEENFYAVAVAPERGLISLGAFSYGTLTSFRPLISIRKDKKLDWNFGGVTADPLGVYLAATRIGTKGADKDAKLSMFSPSGKWLADYDLDLYDPVAVGYQKKSGRMFALDASYANPDNGGLFELIAKGQDRCEVVKVCDIQRGTSMAFDGDGVLYVTTLGADATVANENPAGKLLKIILQQQADSNE